MRKRLGIAVLLLAMPLSLPAQSTFGAMLGTVTDETGAVVPNAKITITNQGENVSHVLAAQSEAAKAWRTRHLDRLRSARRVS